MSPGARLKEERERLGFSQTEFAALTGASKKTQIRWEQGESHPGSDALAIWMTHGLDVLYVLSGQRAGTSPAPALTKEERNLLDNYRNSDERGKLAVQSAALALAEHHSHPALPLEADAGHRRKASGK